MYDTILVAVDGSEDAARAVRHALEQAEQFDATLHAVYVVDIRLHGEPALSSTELVLDDLEDQGQQLLDDVRDRANDSGVAVDTRCCHGVPHEEIVDYGAAVDADAIVMGFQGRSHSRSDHIGSVAERVVRHAGRPVFVV